MLAEMEVTNKLEQVLKGWRYVLKWSGVSLWIYINNDEDQYYQIQVTPDNGVAVSRIFEHSDFAHEESFVDLEAALNFIRESMRSDSTINGVRLH